MTGGSLAAGAAADACGGSTLKSSGETNISGFVFLSLWVSMGEPFKISNQKWFQIWLGPPPNFIPDYTMQLRL